jgi:hypothetical protein
MSAHFDSFAMLGLLVLLIWNRVSIHILTLRISMLEHHHQNANQCEQGHDYPLPVGDEEAANGNKTPGEPWRPVMAGRIEDNGIALRSPHIGTLPPGFDSLKNDREDTRLLPPC